MNEIDPPKWVKSSFCSAGTCVEVAKIQDEYLVRDSKRPGAAPLTFTADEWDAFIKGVHANEFRF